MEKYYKHIKKKEAWLGPILSIFVIALTIFILYAAWHDSVARNIVLVFGGLVNIFSVVEVLKFIFKGYLRKIKRTIRKNNLNPELIASDLDKNADKYPQFLDTVFLGDKYALFMSADSNLVVYDNVVWMYTETTTSETAKIKFTNHYIVFVDRNKKKYSALINNDPTGEKCNQIVEILKKRIPWCYVDGYSHLHKMYKKDFSTMLDLVDQKKQKIKYEQQGDLSYGN